MRIHGGVAATWLTTAVLLAGCASRRAAPAHTFDREAARREVYAAVLRQVYAAPHVERFVIDPLTVGTDAWGTERLKRLAPDTRRDFLRRPGGGRLPENLDAGAPIVWFTEADWKALPVPERDSTSFLGIEDRWTAFHAAQPRSAGKMSFSDVGFGADGRQALLHVWTGSASLSGHGLLVLLERKAAGWTVVDQTGTIIA